MSDEPPTEDDPFRLWLAGLSERERQALRERFGVEVPTDVLLREVGQQFELIRERLRALEAKASERSRARSSLRPGALPPATPASADDAWSPARYRADAASANDDEFGAAPDDGRDPEPSN